MDLQGLIEEDRERGTFRVHRSTMTSPEFHQLELERIFLRCWLYVGHESEIPKPGDYLRRSVGGWPVMFVRGKDGVPRVFLNTCPHRGALVCRQDRGNANLFQCFYHAWTFNNQGELVGTPEEEGYAAGFDPKERSLVPPPRVENYRGMVFLSYNPEVESLVSYLGDARLFLDTFLDQAGKDRMRVLPGTYRVNVQANWKLMIENTADFYHVVPTHISFIHYLNGIGKRLASQQPNYRMLGISLGQGHFGRFTTGAKGSGYPGARVDPVFDQDTEQRMQEFRGRLINRHGPDMESWTPERGGVSNFVVYPNLAIAHGMRAVRTFYPVSATEFEFTTWAVVPESYDEEQVKDANQNEFFDAQGPGGFQQPDDFEALESCQQGFVAKGVPWSDISRGMHRPSEETDELPMRVFWRQWHADIQGFPRNVRTDDWESLEEFEKSAGLARAPAAD